MNNQENQVMKNQVKLNVKKGLNNIKLWFECQYSCEHPTTYQIFSMYNNEWLVGNMGYQAKGSADNFEGFEAMDEQVLINELNRLRSLKSNQMFS